LIKIEDQVNSFVTVTKTEIAASDNLSSYFERKIARTSQKNRQAITDIISNVVSKGEVKKLDMSKFVTYEKTIQRKLELLRGTKNLLINTQCQREHILKSYFQKYDPILVAIKYIHLVNACLHVMESLNIELQVILTSGDHDD